MIHLALGHQDRRQPPQHQLLGHGDATSLKCPARPRGRYHANVAYIQGPPAAMLLLAFVPDGYGYVTQLKSA